MNGPLYRGAITARRLHMKHARECMAEYRRTLDPVYAEMARVHVKTARQYNRNSWRAKSMPGNRP